jgi:hypothetical protein
MNPIILFWSLWLDAFSGRALTAWELQQLANRRPIRAEVTK